jgi:hypothetical protein
MNDPDVHGFHAPLEGELAFFKVLTVHAGSSAGIFTHEDLS